MSRSRCKTPITAMTSATSDKAFKQAEHRRERRAVKAVDLTLEEPPAVKAFGDPWIGKKDGKQWFDPRQDTKLMRK